MDNTINDTIFKKKYLKYKKKYLHLKYSIGGKKSLKSNSWVKNFNSKNKKSFILFFNRETLKNNNQSEDEQQQPDLKSIHDIETVIAEYNKNINTNDYIKKTQYTISDSLIFNNLALFKYNLGRLRKKKYNKGYIVPWIELIDYNFNTVRKQSATGHYKQKFMSKLRKLKKLIKSHKLNITITNLIKKKNFNNYDNLLQKLIENINNIIDTPYVVKILELTNEYNNISTNSVILNGINNEYGGEDNTNITKQQYVTTSRIKNIDGWVEISNVKYNNKQRVFTFNITSMCPSYITFDGSNAGNSDYNY